MDKIARIRQKIERRIKLCNAAPICSVRAEVNKQLRSRLLSEEPDKSLEEVDLDKEIDACWQNWLSPSNQKEVEGVLPKTEFTMYARHFAEWQKEQMLKDAVEGEAEELYNDGESQCVVGVGTYFKPGDKVYVLKA